VNAVKDVAPGEALDVGMGQGRNAIYLATRGWAVTGFDVADAGLAAARQRATELGVRLNAVHASDEEFDFGKARWDLIAIIYAIENRSVHRVREALRPGGLVVIEAGLHDESDAPFGFQSQELLRIFAGFRIVTYVETMDTYDWGPETIRLVRLVAQKPR
jgi:2-polyprenyl-3-methyl-5-hydroxy-6-metoxy-1,4-benzoquinol methylase